MVKNTWSDAEAAQYVDAAGDDPADRELALRVYTSRLIGRNPDLVMHGGGNTSVKLMRPDIFGNDQRVLHVKGSGWDLETIEAAGLPAVRMDPLMDLRQLDRLSDEDMVNIQRCNLLDSTSPNPSVETLLHAYLPHTYVDHTHATAFLALANLPDVEEAVREIFGGKMAIVPYIMPGFDLAKAAAQVYDANPTVEGLLLANHGHFTFGDSAKASYDKVIEHTNMVERWFEQRCEPVAAVSAGSGTRADDILPTLRGVLGDALAEFTQTRDIAMPVFDLRTGDGISRFLQREDVADLARRGVATPDHVIRTKRFPLHLTGSDLEAGRPAISSAVAGFIDEYRACFDRQVVRHEGGKVMIAPTPNVFWIEGLGVVGSGANKKAAKIAADIAEQTLTVIADAEAAGAFRPIGEADTFDMEYWSLEQAKLGKGSAPRFSGKVVLVTGAAGAIGLATAKAFQALGAEVFVIDKDSSALKQALKSLGANSAGITVDITHEDGAETALAACIAEFGGIDILVSNAGAAWSGTLLDLDVDDLRKSFELNFFAHLAFGKAAARCFAEQGHGGQILFNVSKQAVNPGKGFGAYGLPKATTFFLLRQMALEFGDAGIRVNGINADRIRSGLLTDGFIEERSKARGIDAQTYMAGNILKREVEARHVADAFVALAQSERTTGHVMTVDGGNIEAALR